MAVKKIIIISSSEQIRDFFRLEALNFDFSVESIEKIDKAHNDISSYDLAIIDLDSIKQKPLNTAKKEITVSSQGKKADMLYPCLISEVRQVYNSICACSNFKADDVNQHGVKIAFYSNEKNLVSVNNRKYILSDTEYKILSVLCKSSQQIVLREKIHELFENGNSNIGDVYICRLRKKLEEPSGQRLIFTVREKGYKIAAEVEWR